MVQTSHSLRTHHRVVVPYHGLPGKHAALRTVFAAGELAQAKVVVVIDPNGPATTAERVTELIGPISRADADFLAPRYRRHPRDGVLITQLVRPLVRALYGVALDEPLGAEFACSGRFASHCLEQDIWSHDAVRFAIDLWLRTEAIAGRFTVGQIWRPATTAAGARTTLREAVHQVGLSLVESLRAHESFWTEGQRHHDAAHVGHAIRWWRPTSSHGTTRPSPSRRVTTSARSRRCSRTCSGRTWSRQVLDDKPAPACRSRTSCG